MKFICYEDGMKKVYSMRKMYRLYCTVVDDEQKSMGTTFDCWLTDITRMNLVTISY